MSIDVVVVSEHRHAVVVLSGHVEPGCRPALEQSLRICARAHTVVDLRHVDGLTPEVSKALLCGLGLALDRRRTLRIVVRDDLQRRALASHGLKGMVPMHASIAEATDALELDIAIAGADALHAAVAR